MKFINTDQPSWRTQWRTALMRQAGWPTVQVASVHHHRCGAVSLQANLGVPAGTIKATVLIETLPAAFEMDEILYELRQHSAGLNCGRWDYIFSFIKTMRADPSYIMPDRCAPSAVEQLWL